MNKILFATLLSGLGLLLAQLPSFAGPVLAPAAGMQYAPDQVLVKFKPGVTAAARTRFAQSYGAQSLLTLAHQPDVAVTRLAPGQTVAQAVNAYANDPNVAYAQPNYIYHTQAIPNDTQYAQQWAAKNTGQTPAGSTYSPSTGTAGDDMSLESAWNVQTDCSTVVVAVLDTGINYNSTDLAANMWAGNAMHGNNFAPDGAAGDPMDLDGHGTHVAGIIGAVGNNANGVAGVCWKANLMAVRALDATGMGFTSNIINGIGWAVTNGAKIINMSLAGGGALDQAFSNAITSAQTSNVLVVAAAGNSAQNNDTTPTWPCSFTQANLVCVAALDQNYALAAFSNFGATSVDVGAPGANIYSTWAGTNTVVATDLATNVTPAGWVGSSTTAGTGGGWGATTGGWLIDPAANWGTALYNANTDDRAYKSFTIPAGATVAMLSEFAAFNVINGDYFNINYAASAVSVDPFATGINVSAITGFHTGTSAPFLSQNITPCIGTTCSIGFQLKSGGTMPKDLGVAVTQLSITTLTLNNTSFNTISGTSMATPEVTGVAALVWAHNPLYTYSDVANSVKNGGRSIAALSGKTTSGKAANAMGSLAYINPPTGITVTVK